MIESLHIAAALTWLDAFRIFPWRLRPDRRDGSKRRFPSCRRRYSGSQPAISGSSEFVHARLVARLNEVTSTLAGKPVSVDCETPVIVGFADNEGEVWFLEVFPRTGRR